MTRGALYRITVKRRSYKGTFRGEMNNASQWIVGVPLQGARMNTVTSHARDEVKHG